MLNCSDFAFFNLKYHSIILDFSSNYAILSLVSVMAFYEKHTQYDPSFPLKFQQFIMCKGVAFRMHWHENVEILSVTRGMLNLQLGGQDCILKEGDTFVINSQQLHGGQALDGGSDYFCLIFDLNACKWLGIPVKNLSFTSPIGANWIREELTACKKLLTETKERPYRNTEVKLRLMMLFTRLAQEYSSVQDTLTQNLPEKSSKLSRRIISYIDQHFLEPITTESICNTFGYNKSYICHSFRDATGMTLTEYLQYRRCFHAQKLLKTGDYNVSEVALKCGFANFSFFSRVYRRCMGVAPSDETPYSEKTQRFRQIL